jgi:hypothetical protein
MESATTAPRSTHENCNIDAQGQNFISISDSAKGRVYMQTAQIQFENDGKPCNARLYLDPGSTRSYITTNLARKLGLKTDAKFQLQNAVFGQLNRQAKECSKVMLPIPFQHGEHIAITAYATDAISCPLQKLPLDLDRFPILKQIPLADTVATEIEYRSIDILIGGDYYYDFMTNEQIRVDGGLILLGSKFGYLTAGKVNEIQPVDDVGASFLNVTGHSPSQNNPGVNLRHTGKVSQLNSRGSTVKIASGGNFCYTRSDPMMERPKDYFRRGRFSKTTPGSSICYTGRKMPRERSRDGSCRRIAHQSRTFYGERTTESLRANDKDVRQKVAECIKIVCGMCSI